MPAIHVSKFIKMKLDKIKNNEEHSSYDSVIRILIEKNEK